MSYPVTTMTHTGTDVSTVSIEVVGNDSDRTYLLVQNQGSSSVWIRWDGGVAVADRSADKLLPGQSMEPKPNMTASSVTAISLTGSVVHVVAGGPPSPILFVNVIDGTDNVVDGTDNVVDT